MKYILQSIFFTLLLSLALCSRTNSTLYNPQTYKPFLMTNRLQQCEGRPTQPKLVRSYFGPASYFDSVPRDQRIPDVHKNKQPEFVGMCNYVVSVAALDEYEFQTERFLTAIGLNIYDGAVWGIAVSLLQEADEAIKVEKEIIQAGETCQFDDVRGDGKCNGVIVTNECVDTTGDGYCGFCYGSGTLEERTLPKENALSFRMISDYWALDGTVDARCPEKNFRWTWNDYRPILGENSWAFLLGPMQVAYIKYGSVTAIPSDDISINMAIAFLPSLVKMLTTIGAVSYAPKNTLAYANRDSGFDVSTENNISLLGGLKMLRYIITQKNIHMDKMADLNHLIDSITSYIQSSYDKTLGYFRQGGSFDPISGQFSWATGTSVFAVDCQTWAMSVISPLLIDQWFGDKASVAIWEATKKLGGYNCNPVTGYCDGVGFTINTVDQVFSGEWTLGAVNMLRVFSKQYNNPSFDLEAQHMLDAVTSQLVVDATIDNQQVTGVLYANKRYWIPFGWWANPLLSTVSTAWTILVESNFNPFFLGGSYSVNY